MKRIPVVPNLEDFPQAFHTLLLNAPVFDSSCSEAARVYYIQNGDGFYLKTAAKGSLKREAEMTRYYHRKGFAPEVLSYESLERDWLLTVQVPGEDCLDERYLADPKRLSALLGELLRQLHDCDFDGCPQPNRTEEYIAAAFKHHEKGQYDLSYFPYPATVEDVWKIVRENASLLKRDTLLHGDYCLPNVMLDNWRFSGFIDVDHGGAGERHIDLYWGCWTLNFNLGSQAFRDRFLDAYGRDKVNEDMLPIIGAFEVFG